MQNQLLDGFRLRDKRVEPLTGTVRGRSGTRHLAPKGMEVLLFLARRPRRLVSREEILASVWGRTATSQEALNHAISEIRQALCDSAENPGFIQTVPTRGFRLLVEPTLLTSSEQAADDKRQYWHDTLIQKLLARGVVQAAAAFLVVGWLLIQVADAVVPIVGLPDWTRPLVTFTVIAGFPVVVLLAWFFEFAEGRLYLDRGKIFPAARSGLERNYVTIFAAYLLTGAAASVYQYTVGFTVAGVQPIAQSENVRGEFEVLPNSIAVLRFLNIDGSEQSEIFSHGFAEDVLDRLARVPGLLVSARGDSWSLPVNATSADVRNRLRVAFYLEGSVRLVGDELRVVAQLIDSATGFHVVSRSFSERVEEFMQVQNDITDLTVANLRVALPEDPQMLFADNFVDSDVDAYMLYRRAREILRDADTAELSLQAEALYMRALDIDTDYAAAHAGLCSLKVRQYLRTSDAAFIDAAETSCARGLSTNPNLYMVHTALGDLYSATGESAKAVEAYLQSLDINPQDVNAMSQLAIAYERQGRFEDAEKLLRDAIRLQPGNWEAIDALGFLMFANGRYSEAANAYRQVTLIDPNNFQGHGNLGSALLMSGDFAASASALEKALDLEPDLIFASNLGVIYYYLGDYDRSVELHQSATRMDSSANFAWLNLGDSLWHGGDHAAAAAAFARSASIARANLEINARDAERTYELAWATAMLGDLPAARDLMQRSLELDPENPYVHYYDALIRNRDSDAAGALVSLGNAVAAGYPVALLSAEPYFAELRTIRAFQALTNDTVQ